MSRNLLQPYKEIKCGSYKTITFNNSTAIFISAISARTTLSSTKTSTPTYTRTLTSSDIISTVDTNIIFDNLLCIYVGGLNLSASTSALSFDIQKNSASIYTSTMTNCVANQYWTMSIFPNRTNTYVVGDIIDVYIWGSVNCDVGYFAIGSRPSGFVFEDGKTNRILLNLNINIASGTTLANPTLTNYQAKGESGRLNGYLWGSALPMALSDPLNSAIIYFNTYCTSSGYNNFAYFTNSLDFSIPIGPYSKQFNNATGTPQYTYLFSIQSISYRPTNIFL